MIKKKLASKYYQITCIILKCHTLNSIILFQQICFFAYLHFCILHFLFYCLYENVNYNKIHIFQTTAFLFSPLRQRKKLNMKSQEKQRSNPTKPNNISSLKLRMSQKSSNSSKKKTVNLKLKIEHSYTKYMSSLIKLNVQYCSYKTIDQTIRIRFETPPFHNPMHVFINQFTL